MTRRVLWLLAFVALPKLAAAAPLTPAQEQQLMQGAYDVWPRVSDADLISHFQSKLVNMNAPTIYDSSTIPYTQDMIDAGVRFEDIIPELQAQAALPGGLPANTRYSLNYLYDKAPTKQVFYSLDDSLPSVASFTKNATTGLVEPNYIVLNPTGAASIDSTMVSTLNHEVRHWIQVDQYNLGISPVSPNSAVSSPSRLAAELDANVYEAWDMDQGLALTNLRYGSVGGSASQPGYDAINKYLFDAPGWQVAGDSQTVFNFVQDTAANSGSGSFIMQREQFFQAAQASGALEQVPLTTPVTAKIQNEVGVALIDLDQSKGYSVGLSTPNAAELANQAQLATDSLASKASVALDASVDFAGGAIISTAIMETLTYGFTLGSNRLFGQGLVDSGNLLVQDPGKYALFSANEQYADHVAGTIADLMTAPPPQSPMDVLMMGANPMIELSDITKTVGAGVAQMLGIDVPKLQANIQGTVQLGLNDLTGVTPEDDPMYIENFVHAVNVLQSQTSAETYAGMALQANQNDLFWNQMLDFRNQQMEIGQIFNSPTAWITNEVVPNDSATIQVAASPSDLATLNGQMTLLSTPSTPAYTGGEVFQDLNPQPALALVPYDDSSDTSVNLVSNVAVPNGVMVSNPMLSNIGLDYRPLDTVLPVSSWLPSYKAVPGVQPDFGLPAVQVGQTLDPSVEDVATMAAAAAAAIGGMLAGDLSLVLNPYGSIVTNTATSVNVLGYDGSNQDDSFLGAVVPSDDSFWGDDD